ncbi:YceI family protein [Phenylobacterium sp.]|uniref:YceI family protein n=1 Tax=Phenylobacterium sp. TaxID=1871053 RepID=UPI002F414419
MRLRSLLATLPLVASILAMLGAGEVRANPSTTDPAKVPAGTYVLDKKHASLTIRIVHMGFSHYTLRFDRLDGGFTYDPAAWQSTKVTFTVDPASVDTNDAPFDRQIAGYFQADKYPAIAFVSTGLQGGPDGKGVLTGDLTFHGVTRPVTLDVTFGGAGQGISARDRRLGFSGVTHIKRSDFGVNAMLQYASDDVEVIFDVEFEQQ